MLGASVKVGWSKQATDGRGRGSLTIHAIGTRAVGKVEARAWTVVACVRMRHLWRRVGAVEGGLRRRIASLLLLLRLGLRLLLVVGLDLLLLALLEIHHQRIVATRVQNAGRSRCLDLTKLAVRAAAGRARRRRAGRRN